MNISQKFSGWRESTIEKLGPINTWEPEKGRVLTSRVIEFRNGEAWKAWRSTEELHMLSVGDLLYYQIKEKTTDNNGELKKTYSMAKYYSTISMSLERRMRLMDDEMRMIVESAKIAGAQYPSLIAGHNKSPEDAKDLKEPFMSDIAGHIYSWMKAQYLKIDVEQLNEKMLVDVDPEAAAIAAKFHEETKVNKAGDLTSAEMVNAAIQKAEENASSPRLETPVQKIDLEGDPNENIEEAVIEEESGPLDQPPKKLVSKPVAEKVEVPSNTENKTVPTSGNVPLI